MQIVYRSPAELELATRLDCHTLAIFFGADDEFSFHDWQPLVVLTQALQKVLYGSVGEALLAVSEVPKLLMLCTNPAESDKLHQSQQ